MRLNLNILEISGFTCYVVEDIILQGCCAISLKIFEVINVSFKLRAKGRIGTGNNKFTRLIHRISKYLIHAFVVNLTLCVPCIIFQCVDDQ